MSYLLHSAHCISDSTVGHPQHWSFVAALRYRSLNKLNNIISTYQRKKAQHDLLQYTLFSFCPLFQHLRKALIVDN